MTTQTYLWLYDIAAKIDVDYEDYACCEHEVIGPALKRLGYELRGSWFTGDGDSFGPLTRCVCTDKGTVVYG
jgi:hypothetical protein